MGLRFLGRSWVEDGQQHRNVEVCETVKCWLVCVLLCVVCDGLHSFTTQNVKKFRYRFFEPAGFDLTLERQEQTSVSSRLAAVILRMAVPLDADCWP